MGEAISEYVRRHPKATGFLGHTCISPASCARWRHSVRRTRHDSADKIAALAGLSDVGNKRETIDSVEPEEAELSDCFDGPRVGIERINSKIWRPGSVTGRDLLSGKSRHLPGHRLTLAYAA